MVVKDTPQIIKRISIRWLPDDSYENTDTVALNVGGFFMDLRVNIADKSLEWARSGKREAISDKDPATFQWSRMIDSLGSSQTDEAAFRELPNGDDLEFGEFNKDGTLIPYEEVWRDVTSDTTTSGSSWIVQSKNGSAFYGKVGNVFLAMRRDEKERFGVRREDYDILKKYWTITFEAGLDAGPELERAERMVIDLESGKGSSKDEVINGYVILGYESHTT